MSDDIRRTFGLDRDEPAPPPCGIPKPPDDLLAFANVVNNLMNWVAIAFMALWFGGCVEVQWAPGKAKAAPAPVYKSPPPLERRIEGGWHMDWGSGTGTCYLSPQGFWGATLGGTTWHGRWTLEKNVLTVHEQRLDEPDSSELKWSVVLDEEPRPGGGAVGVINGFTAFVLRPDPTTRR